MALCEGLYYKLSKRVQERERKGKNHIKFYKYYAHNHTYGVTVVEASIKEVKVSNFGGRPKKLF